MKEDFRFHGAYVPTIILAIYALINFLAHIFGWFLGVRFWFPLISREHFITLIPRALQIDVLGFLVIVLILSLLSFLSFYPWPRHLWRWFGFGGLLLLFSYTFPFVG